MVPPRRDLLAGDRSLVEAVGDLLVCDLLEGDLRNLDEAGRILLDVDCELVAVDHILAGVDRDLAAVDRNLVVVDHSLVAADHSLVVVDHSLPSCLNNIVLGM